jgi:UDP-glucose 4-epimerase
VIPLFITAMLQGRQPVIYGDGRQTRDFSYVANMVHGNLLAAEAAGAGGRIVNLANGRTTDLLTLLAALKGLLGLNIQPRHEPPRMGDIRDSMADITQARHLLGYEVQVEFEEGLRRSIDYYRSQANVRA